MITVIVAGGEIDLPFFEKFIEDARMAHGEDGLTVIAADRGLEACLGSGADPDYVIGDFDSVDSDVIDEYLLDDANAIKLNPIKDDTDTEAALNFAFDKTEGDIYILGCMGRRVDHFLGNVAILGLGFAHERNVFLLDPYNRVRMIQKECTILKSEQYGKYVSVVPFTGEARGVSLSGFFYDISDETMYPFASLGISNEIVEEEARISVRDGFLVVVESRD